MTKSKKEKNPSNAAASLPEEASTHLSAAVKEDFFSRHGQLIVCLGVIFLLLFSLFAVRDILLPFVVGGIVAYFLSPIVSWLSKKGIGRGVASAIFVVLSIVIFATILFRLVPLIGDQLLGLIERAPQAFAALEQRISSWIASMTAAFGMERVEQIQGEFEKRIEQRTVRQG